MKKFAVLTLLVLVTVACGPSQAYINSEKEKIKKVKEAHQITLQNEEAAEKEVGVAIVQKIAKKLQEVGKKRVVVAYYSDVHGRVSTLGRFVSELLNVGLSNYPGREFEIISRVHLAELLQQHKLGTTGLLKLSQASKIGKLLGADVIVVGTIMKFENPAYRSHKKYWRRYNMLFLSKGIDVNTGRVMFATHYMYDAPARLGFNTMSKYGISGRDIFQNPPIGARFKSVATFNIGKTSVACQGLGMFKTRQHAQAKLCYIAAPGFSEEFTCYKVKQKAGQYSFSSKFSIENNNNDCNSIAGTKLLQEMGINNNFL